jgi:hypothetical protein
MIVVTAFVGALVAGFAAMSGSSLRPLERSGVVKERSIHQGR